MRIRCFSFSHLRRLFGALFLILTGMATAADEAAISIRVLSAQIENGALVLSCEVENTSAHEVSLMEVLKRTTSATEERPLGIVSGIKQPATITTRDTRYTYFWKGILKTQSGTTSIIATARVEFAKPGTKRLQAHTSCPLSLKISMMKDFTADVIRRMGELAITYSAENEPDLNCPNITIILSGEQLRQLLKL